MIKYNKDKTNFTIIKKDWINITSPNFGKWLIYHKNPKFLIKFVDKLNQLVKKGKINQVKFINAVESKKIKNSFLPKQKESVLLIYCWKRSKIKVKKTLENIGLKPRKWKSNLNTVIDWFPGGKLYEDMKKSLPNFRFEENKKHVVNINYWNYEKRKLKKYLSKDRYKKIEQNFFKEFCENGKI